jgi:hypothetical protein
MEAACYVGMINEWNQLIVGAAFEVPVTFTQVHVDLDGVLDCWHCGRCANVDTEVGVCAAVPLARSKSIAFGTSLILITPR